MRKFLASLLLAAVAALAIPLTSNAQVTKQLGFVSVADYQNYLFRSTGSVAAGANTITIQGDASFTTPGGRTVYPFSTSNYYLFDGGGASPETLNPSAVTCVQNAGQQTCTITATFVSAHTGNFTVQSGTHGLAEAIADLTAGTVVVGAGYGGTFATDLGNLKSGVGSTLKSILDLTGGKFQFYAYGGSTYAATVNPTTQLAPAATVTAKTGTAYFNAGIQDNTTNHDLVLVGTGANAVGATEDCLKTRAATAAGPATTTIVTADVLCSFNVYGADGTNYINTAGIDFISTGTIASTRVPSKITFSTGTDAAPTVKTIALTLNADQSAVFAGAITNTGTLTMAGTAVINKTSGSLTLQTTTSGNVVLAPAAAATAAVTTAARLEMAQGATITTGGGQCVTGDCTLGGDGNLFLVSGTTAVDGFATAGWQAGSLIVIHTDGNLTLNNAGTVAGGYGQLLLVGGANVSMTANDYMLLVFDGTAWDQVAPTLVK